MDKKLQSHKLWDVFIHPRPESNGLNKTVFKVRYRSVITPTSMDGCDYLSLSYYLAKVTPSSGSFSFLGYMEWQWKAHWRPYQWCHTQDAPPIPEKWSLHLATTSYVHNRAKIQCGYSVVNFPKIKNCHNWHHIARSWGRAIGFLLWVQFLIHVILNTLRPRQNGRNFADDIFKCIFLNENAWISIKISLRFVPQGPINNIPAPGRRQAIIWTNDD